MARVTRAGVLAVGFSLALVSSPRLAHAGPPEGGGPTISLESSPELDAAISARLEAIYAGLDSLAEVEVEVEAGVVHLRGQVLELDARDEAEAIARRLEGVVAVDNGVEQIHAVSRRIDPLVQTLETRALEFWAFAPLLLVGLLIILVAWFLARLLGRSRRLFRRAGSNEFVRELAGQLLRAGILVLGVVLALELMGATALIGAVLGTAGVVGLALGFAFKDTAENYIASILLSVRKPFEPNDLVEVDGNLGRVVRLTSRAAILLTLDGNHVRIPNAAVFKATIINYTRNPERRFSFQLGVSVEADLTQVQELGCATLAGTPGVLAEPPPLCLVEGFGDSSMTVSMSAWIDQRQADWFKASSEARRRVKMAFDQAGIEVPEPIFQVRTRSLERSEVDPSRGPRASVEEAATPIDVRPDAHLIEQAAAERAETKGGDLLRADAPIE